MKINEKRTNKGYKIHDSVYVKAMRRARKDKKKLARLIESFVLAYSTGDNLFTFNNDANE